MFLINMKAGQKPYESQISGNLKQLAGWMRAWAAGRNLGGSNDWGPFDVALTDVDWVVLISVVKGADAHAEFHHDKTDALAARYPKIAAVVSIPEGVLLNLIQRGGTALDLADLLLALAVCDRLSEDAAMGLLSDLHLQAITSVRFAAGQVEDRDDAFDTEFSQRLMQGLRATPRESLTTPGDAEISDRTAVFNDLDWSENAQVIFAITDITAHVREVPIGEYGPTGSCVELVFSGYTFLIAAGDLRRPVESMRPLEQFYEAHPHDCIITIMNWMNGRPVVEFYTQTIAFSQAPLPPSAVGRLLGTDMREARDAMRNMKKTST